MVMIVEVVTRIGYAFKHIKEGYSVKESIPFSMNREKHPKLATMLFIGHSAATAVNAGKVYFTQNPMAINYPQWIAFAKYSYKICLLLDIIQVHNNLYQYSIPRYNFLITNVPKLGLHVLSRLDSFINRFLRIYWNCP